MTDEYDRHRHEPRLPCPSCRRWLRRLARRWRPAGRHDAHRCEGQTIGRYAAFVCDCHCRQDVIASIVANGGFPSMYLDGPPTLPPDKT